jgi:type II secretory ATPase GspE/PulE/Tfp pilus assembly ATPase PilB-like protein
MNKAVYEAILKSRLIDESALQKYSLEAQKLNIKLTTHLLREDVLSSDAIIKALSESLSLSAVNLRNLQVDRAVIERVPVKFASFFRFVPVSIDGSKLTVAVSEPLDIHDQDDIRAHLGFEVKCVLAPSWDIEEALKKYYGLASETIEQILTKDSRKNSVYDDTAIANIEDIEKQTEDPSVTKLVNQIIFEAYQKRATDIHIEPYRNKVRFRYRVDGVLLDANLPAEARHFLLPILSRIKIMANLSITERRLPQDGSAVVRVKEQKIDLRVSTIPTQHGESMVIRLLPAATTLLDLKKLGFNKDNARKFRELITRPHGVIFVTGPTGSGKTTTLYACLHEINKAESKIITIEDPVEYEMEGITQIQVSPSVHFDFAMGLRSVLRHDPDILMVGEVRDRETADIAIRTALTGHLVFSSLHTNDASSGVTRLVDMGVEPYLVASSVQAFVAQRLVRVICPDCKEEDPEPLTEIRQEIADSLGFSSLNEIKIWKGKGCDHCNGTGYYGRTAIYEILEINEAVRSVILEKPRAEDIKRMAVQQGMRTLRQDAWQTVISGVTTPAEVLNVTIKEEPVAVSVQRMLPTSLPPGHAPLPRHRFRASSADEDPELRLYPRLSQDVQVHLSFIRYDKDSPSVVTSMEKAFSVFTRDISASGLNFYTEGPLSTGTILGLRIFLPDDDLPFECLARITRVAKEGPSGKLMAACSYLDIAPRDRQRIIQFASRKII